MKNRSDIIYLSCSGILFGLFLLNIFLGKAALAFGIDPILSLGDVGEFLVLLAAVICFVVEVLRLEYNESIVKIESANSAEEDV